MTLDPDVFDRAADDVSRDGGWLQGQLGAFEESDAAVCAMGAVYRQCHKYRAGGLSQHLDHLKATLGLPDVTAADFKDPIAKWNDQPGRTAGEVADAFRTAAKVLRG